MKAWLWSPECQCVCCGASPNLCSPGLHGQPVLGWGILLGQRPSQALPRTRAPLQFRASPPRTSFLALGYG